MRVLFSNKTSYNFDKSKIELIENVIKETLRSENFKYDTEISVTIVTNDEIKNINKKYRNIDRETDVLSFPLIDFKTEKINYENNKTIILGDIIISIEKAEEQSIEYGHSIEREIGFLTVHSMLHLLGYDHMEKQEEIIMFEKQEEILDNIGLKR